jgi:hypothetical protein
MEEEQVRTLADILLLNPADSTGRLALDLLNINPIKALFPELFTRA